MIKNLQDKTVWHDTFILFPRVIENKFVWLETVQQRWDDESGSSCASSGYSFANGAWEYKL